MVDLARHLDPREDAAGGGGAEGRVLSVCAVVVTYDEDPAVVRAAIDSLRAQTRQPDEILLVDNKPGAALPPLEDAPEVRVIAPDRNLGYPNAINFAVEHTDATYVLTLNPDAQAEPECLERLLAADAAIAGAQIVSQDGETTQAGDNPLHPTGISPARGYGRPREHGPARDALVVSGACTLFDRETFVGLGGFMRSFFLYYDDADIGWRARLAGERVVYCPEAVVRHGYEFGRRERKMFLLERNRLIALLSNYEARTLAVLTPLLLATEVGVTLLAALQGWLPEKLQAYASVWSLRREVRRHRRHVQSLRQVRDHDLRPLFATRLESPFIPRPASRLLGAVTSAYLRLV
ncbi:MAG: glycosyltransferase family 2 protein [Actinomycetota bacterium]